MAIANTKDITSRERYMGHGLSDPMLQLYMKRGGQSRLMALPICPKCEKIGLRDKGWEVEKTMACPHCGYHGKATHQLSAYLKEGCYK